MTVREQGCSAGAGNERLGASDGDLGAAGGLLRPTSQVTQALRSRLCLTERVTPYGASSAPFGLESHCYASQTRSVRRNPLRYDTG